MTRKLHLKWEDPMKLTLRATRTCCTTMVRRTVLLVMATMLLSGCSILAREYRDETLSLSFEYPPGWEIVDERRIDNTAEVTFQKDLSKWVLIALSELSASEAQNPGKHAEAMLAAKIQERRDLAIGNDGEILQVKQNNLTCDDECCSVHAEILGSRMIDLPSAQVFGREAETESTLAYFAEDISVLSCQDRASEMFAMWYADSDPQIDRFVRKAMESFRQIE